MDQPDKTTASPPSAELISYGRRADSWAEKHPAKAALIFIPVSGEPAEHSWEFVSRRTNQIARLLAERGIDEDSRIVIGLPNCAEHYLVSIAAWKVGAMVIPQRSRQPVRARDEMLATAEPDLVIADWEGLAYPCMRIEELRDVDHFSAEPLPDIIANPGKALGSGGSTGRSKLIVTPGPWALAEGSAYPRLLGLDAGMVHLVCGPLFHNAPFLFSHRGFWHGHTLIIMERFAAARVVDLIEAYQVSYAYMAPIMMSRIAKLPGVKERNLRSMRTLLHTAAPCPPWLKHAWFDLIGPENVLELFAATEAVGICLIRGDEWLEHEGSVGKPILICEMKIRGADGSELPAGEIGEIFMRRTDVVASYDYIGAEPARTDDEGYISVGDMGWVDEEGYLYIADRRVDLIISGGANVFPAEVEAALTEHEAIADVAVIGIPDEEWGKRVHAVVQFKAEVEPPSVAELNQFCRERLLPYKAPKSYDFMVELPRNAAGKLRRSSLILDRAGATSINILPVQG